MLQELLTDDWHQVFGYAGEPAESNSAGCLPLPVANYRGSITPILRVDVAEILAMDEGEKDERTWMLACKLNDGRYLYIEAGCDYTGWDCQASGSAWVANDLQSLILFGLTNEARARLRMPLPRLDSRQPLLKERGRCPLGEWLEVEFDGQHFHLLEAYGEHGAKRRIVMSTHQVENFYNYVVAVKNANS